MYSLSDVSTEIETAIEELDTRNVRALSPDIITEIVMTAWGEIEGDYADRYICTAHAWIRDAVRKRINRYKAEAQVEPDKQLVMPGFERLQKRYLIEEEGLHVAVRIQDMSDGQLAAKANELRAMGAGCFQHADEIDRYMNSSERQQVS